eukprot:CAMPEP_0184856738 /NCGR_PEP_ID=MMETSP0580-20130426/1915_1 /TAXON_ID=1118495 /ORGANISM="Dactyliosolen fragilissimus" /LENGTH=703 /DNA_ID=CAMNT_0027351937 /DNA_START=233 /DNA_END=2341 /DNA_ORIENTATION=-
MNVKITVQERRKQSNRMNETRRTPLRCDGNAFPLVMVMLLISSLAMTASSFSPSFCRIGSNVMRSINNDGKFERAIRMVVLPDENDDYDDDEEEDDDDDDDSSSNSISSSSTSSLGINLNLDPLTRDEAEKLRAEARLEIDKAFDNRLNEIDKLKDKTRKDFEESKKRLAYDSEQRAKEESARLSQKIDAITDKFLGSTKEEREATKMVYRADKSMEGKGMDVGSWGSIGNAEVLVQSYGTARPGLLGSMDSYKSGSKSSNSNGDSLDNEDGNNNSNLSDAKQRRILIVYDDSNNNKQYKQFIQTFIKIITETLDEGFDNTVMVDTYTPTSNIPFGGLNAQTAIFVASSINGKSSAQNILQRILRRTVTANSIGVPPSHLVLLSSLGTQRTDKFPYSMQNIMGGKLTKQAEVEEVIINTVKSRSPDQTPLDYTILHLGDILPDDDAKVKSPFQIAPQDSLDGEVGMQAAANALLQAVAFQPAARNATMTVIGGISPSQEKNYLPNDDWDDWFLRLDGPELIRIPIILSSSSSSSSSSTLEVEVDQSFEQLSEYIQQWSQSFDNGAKGTGLTTPVTVRTSRTPIVQGEGTLLRKGVVLEFKQTQTGAAYMSKNEERELEKQRGGSSSSPSNNNNNNNNKKLQSGAASSSLRQKKEGGVEIFVEKTIANELRIRARRCNMDDSTVVKELSEETIINNLQKAVDIW